MEVLTIVGITFAWFLPRALAVFALYVVVVILFFKFKPKSKEKKEISLDEDDDSDLSTENRIARLNALEASSYDNVDTIMVDNGYLTGEDDTERELESESSSEEEKERVHEREREEDDDDDLPQNTETTETSEVNEMEANYAKVSDEDCIKTQPVESGVFDDVEGFVTENGENDTSDLGNVPNVCPKLIDLEENATDKSQNGSNFDGGDFSGARELFKLYQKQTRDLLSDLEDESQKQDEDMAEETPEQPEPEE